MWLVVYKTNHYPSVYEFKDYSEAVTTYKKLKLKEFNKEDETLMKSGRVYLTKIEDSFGEHDANVEWYIKS